MTIIFKRQQLEMSKSEETGPRVSKCQQMGMYDDESLSKYKSGEEADIGYISLFFVGFLPSQQESNRLIDMAMRTKNLNHLIYIPKIGISYNC